MFIEQHFEPSEIGMLAMCLCVPLVSIRVGKVNKQGTCFYPTSIRYCNYRTLFVTIFWLRASKYWSLHSLRCLQVVFIFLLFSRLPRSQMVFRRWEKIEWKEISRGCLIRYTFGQGKKLSIWIVEATRNSLS